MTASRTRKHHTKTPQPGTYRAADDAEGDARALASGKAVYREEYHQDYGPDRDEALDGTESGREF